MALATCVCLALCVAAAAVGAAPGPREPPGEPCQPDKLTVYKVVLHTFWARDKFPKHYPDWRPPAQWSKVFDVI
ncbi:Spond N domain containing protein [Asbolus verrucosus]|uniref:Spond N domain containing protein n=1 Tax=Asbolus verrucosus TaxID=1661398 RepID=A0A482W021_ASBVE|nr:Spond N domain containing protein [Asbolus verrucosus]